MQKKSFFIIENVEITASAQLCCSVKTLPRQHADMLTHQEAVGVYIADGVRSSRKVGHLQHHRQLFV